MKHDDLGRQAGSGYHQSKSRCFREILHSPELSFLMEGHNAISAKIVEEAGFKAIWASGLSMSCALGLRDRNEASWTQILDVVEFMADATDIPVLLDGDTGFGDYNNFQRIVRKLYQRGVAAVCIEDKEFPKQNSFLPGPQQLADVESFCGKLKAGLDSRPDDDFVIIARTEALVAGHAMSEALRRADAYYTAGADGILIHSRAADATEVLAFAKEWANRCPLLIVPTKYYRSPTELYREAGISVAIWANHTLRASIAGMRDVTRRIARDQSLIAVEPSITPLADIFQLTGEESAIEAERRYASWRPVPGE